MSGVMEQALRPWHPKRHGLFPREFQAHVATLLLVQQRLETSAQQPHPHHVQPPAVFVDRGTWLLSVVPYVPRFGFAAGRVSQGHGDRTTAGLSQDPWI